LITGGTGFIGSYVAARLLERGKQVVLYDAYPDIEAVKGFSDKIAVVRGDINDTMKLLSTVREYKVDIIIHLASLLTRGSQGEPGEAIRVNCEGTENIFNLARVMDLRKVVWASSAAVYGGAFLRHYLEQDERREKGSPNEIRRGAL